MPHGTAGGPLLWFNMLGPERLGLEGFLWGCWPETPGANS